MKISLEECLIVYYMIGLTLILVLQVRLYLAKRNDVRLGRETFSMLHPKPATSWAKVANLMPFIIGPLVWPLLFVLLVDELLKSIRKPIVGDKTIPEGSSFTCRTEYLKRKVNVHEVEADHMVFDPLHMVPSLPFGHLNAGWVAFIDSVNPGDEIWAFKIDPGQSVGQWDEAAKGTRSGIARIKAGKVVGEFVFEGD